MHRIGTSGWIYKHWKGIFYPERLPQRDWLAFYMSRFDTVEINFSFYRLPTRETFAGWKRRAAPGFCYAVKGSRYITHLKRLREPAPHLALLFERLEALADVAGPILWQLPPDFERDDATLEAFLQALPMGYRHTIEFRHASWLTEPVFRLLESHQVALCIPDSPRLPQAIRLTTGWTYLRFHGRNEGGRYTEGQLDWWVGVLKEFSGQGVPAWVYFNNDWYGHAIDNALSLRACLGSAASGPPDRQPALPLTDRA